MRHELPIPKLARLTLWLLLSAGAFQLPAQTITQTMVLQPGQNAVFLEVTPTDTNVADVFSDPAIMSVWQPLVRNSTVSFIQNPDEVPWNMAGWMVYIPTNQPASINNNLYSVTVNTPYLVTVAGTNNVTLNITGQPSLLATAFTPNAYTTRGFPVDPANPPTFQTFFQSSPAHYNNGAGPLTEIYLFNPSSGQWQQATANDPMARDVAYWVYTTGSSSYMAPLTASCPVGSGLNFGVTTFEEDVPLQNTTSNAMTVTITDLGQQRSALVYSAVTNAATQVAAWVPLLKSMTMSLPPGATTVLKLGIERSQIVNGYYGTVLALSDGNGTLLRVPVTAETSTYLQAGLWVGNITVSNVAEVFGVNPTNPTPVAQPFVMRAILHVTPGGNTRLLREVIEMLQTNGTSTNAQYVLLTDMSLLSQPQFTGVTTRNGTSVGRRFSTASFDFDPPGGTNFLTMNGIFGVGNTVGASITLTPTTPTNPFLHRYNPEHNTPQTVYTVTRQIQLTFTATDPSGVTPTDYGVNEIGGNYNETLLGLNQTPLVVSGSFHLTHTMNVPYLNVVQ
jgi:hypothetical protein